MLIASLPMTWLWDFQSAEGATIVWGIIQPVAAVALRNHGAKVIHVM
jgi:hypothetical protein